MPLLYAYHVNEANKIPEANELGLPDFTKLLDKISPYHGAKAFEIVPADTEGRPFGNHGDALMYQVFRKIISSVHIELVDNPDDADFLCVRPNGALLESYQFPGILAERLQELPDIPLVIFPSSALFPTLDPSFMFIERSSPTLWIFREASSFEHVTEKWFNNLKKHNVELYLDHDVVASGHKFVVEIMGQPLKSSHAIIAGRIDSEAVKNFSPTKKNQVNTPPAGVLILKRAIVKWISTNPDLLASRIVAKMIYRSRLNSAADSLLNRLPESVKQELYGLGLPVIKVDLSSQIFVSFDEYKKQIRVAAVVITDRLHVALPAAVLGKRVYLVEAGYHKLTGVYEQSLRLLSNVSLVNDSTNK